jgi:hypothetical protein
MSELRVNVGERAKGWKGGKERAITDPRDPVIIAWSRECARNGQGEVGRRRIGADAGVPSRVIAKAHDNRVNIWGNCIARSLLAKPDGFVQTPNLLRRGRTMRPKSNAPR